MPPNHIAPERAVEIILSASTDSVARINQFTRDVFHTRGGRIGSGMGLLLEGLWGYYVNQHLRERVDEARDVEIAWITHHEYNDFACVYRGVAWDGPTRSGEIIRVEAKSMIASADESKAHFDEMAGYFSPHDLLVVLMWDWVALDEFSFYPHVREQFIGRAKEVAYLRDMLHLKRGGSFVDRDACPDECIPADCTHHGESLNANGKRERLSGPKTRRPANVPCAANFGGLVRMLKTGGEDARREFRRVRQDSETAHAYISFIHRNRPDEEINQYMKAEWLALADQLNVPIAKSASPTEIRDAIAVVAPHFREHLRRLI
jgi:hypothetical protein